MRFRITVRADDIELRGYADGLTTINRLADAVKPLGAIVVASPAADDYNPFTPPDYDVDISVPR